MNKFSVYTCFEQEEDGYRGTVVPMANTSNTSFMLFFPIDPEYAKIINIILQGEEASKTDSHILSAYQTMVNSWKSGDRNLSGIIIDIKFDEEENEELISPTIIIGDSDGNVDSILKINFVQAVILAALEKKTIIVTNELLSNLLPSEDEEESEINSDEKNVKFPIDRQILDIARDIMTGKWNESNENDNSKGENDPKDHQI